MNKNKKLSNPEEFKKFLNRQGDLENGYFDLLDVIVHLVLYCDDNSDNQMKVKFFIEFCKNTDRDIKYDLSGNPIKNLPLNSIVTTHQLLFNDAILARKSDLEFPICFDESEYRAIEKRFNKLKKDIYGLFQIAKMNETSCGYTKGRLELKVLLKGLKNYEDYANSLLDIQHQRFKESGDNELEFYEYASCLNGVQIDANQNNHNGNSSPNNKSKSKNKAKEESENIFEKFNETPSSELDKIKDLDKSGELKNKKGKEIDSLFELL